MARCLTPVEWSPSGVCTVAIKGAPVVVQRLDYLTGLFSNRWRHLRYHLDGIEERLVVGTASTFVPGQHPCVITALVAEVLVVIEAAGDPHGSRPVAPPRLHSKGVGREPRKIHPGQCILTSALPVG